MVDELDTAVVSVLVHMLTGSLSVTDTIPLRASLLPTSGSASGQPETEGLAAAPAMEPGLLTGPQGVSQLHHAPCS